MITLICYLIQTKEREYSHPVYKQIALLNGEINGYSKSELIKKLRTFKLDTEGSRSILAKRLKTFFKKSMLSVNGVQEKNGCSRIRVLFDYYIVIDFEATCEAVRNSSFEYNSFIKFP